MNNLNKARQTAVREAWKNEKTQVRRGMGTRDWSQSEQREIVAKGRAKGYEGHHMKSVRSYPQHAGNTQNIQFLNRSEHINGAHKGSTQNVTNGYYNPKTGTMHNFGNNNPSALPAQALSAPLTQKQQNIAVKRELARMQAVKQAKAERQQSGQSSANKGIEAARQKSAAKAGTSATGQSTNQGIKSFQSKSGGQAAASNSASAGQAGGKSGGQSTGSQVR